MTTYSYYAEYPSVNYYEPQTSVYNYSDVNLNAYYYQNQGMGNEDCQYTPQQSPKYSRELEMAQIQRNEELVQMLSPIRKCQERIQAGQTKRNAENARRKFSLTNGVKKTKNPSPPAQPDPKRTSLSMRRWKTEIVAKLQHSSPVPPFYYAPHQRPFYTDRWSGAASR
ncbi:unnamed protein product [Bursaphelenchus xylophilus]|uniref:(pine wood nematode) hypothetical protein n=1 Tax=Bursaphelenchus xylophilus TaxID=6326 RepID=A0A1I7RP33_BURXY|nr:unnamed protein product [Bursaphelenchus xylophilus]CAG9124502.1 unnamed protein product [Bursaphelenchus xylophilus]